MQLHLRQAYESIKRMLNQKKKGNKRIAINRVYQQYYSAIRQKEYYINIENSTKSQCIVSNRY